MNDISSDDIFLLKQRLAEQEALIHALQEKLSNREREIDHLQAQLDKLRRMNFGSRSEKVSRRIAQMEADLNRLQKESDTLTGRVYDPAVQRPLRQTRTRKPFPESLPRDEKRLLPAAPCCPNCGGSLSYLGEDTAEQLELMRSAFRVIRTVREKHACTQCDAIVQAPAPSRPIERGIAGPGLLARVLTSKYAEHTPLYRQSFGALTGRVVGGVLGGMIASAVSGKIAGALVEEDRVKILAMIQEQVTWLAGSFLLTGHEIENLNENLARVIDQNALEIIFAAGIQQRAATNMLIKPLVVSIIRQRPVMEYDASHLGNMVNRLEEALPPELPA